MTGELHELFSHGSAAGQTIHRDAGTLWLATPGDPSDAHGRALDAADVILRAAQTSAWPDVTRLIGLDYTLVAQLRGASGVLLARGPFSRTPLYVDTSSRVSPLATQLGADGVTTRQDFLPHLLANACLPCPVECDHTPVTAASGWCRIPRATVTEYRDGRVGSSRSFGLPRYSEHATQSREALEEALRGAVDERISALARHARAAAELSGGLDSGIIVARARKVLGARFLGGVSIVTPYPELRRERSFIDATTAQAGVPTVRLDVERHLPFARLEQAPLHDEPSLSSLPWALMEASLEAARGLGAGVHLHGIGGDQVFAPPPARFTALDSWSMPLSFLTWGARSAFRGARRQVRNRCFAGGEPLFAEQGTLLYDGWIDRHVAPALGLRFEGVYLDPRIIRLCEALRAYEAARGPAKAIARRAFADDLAPAVLTRRGKVGFDGVYQRGLRRHLDDVLALLEGDASSLEAMRVSPARVAAGLDRCARRGWGSEATPLFAVLAWVVWRQALKREGRLRA